MKIVLVYPKQMKLPSFFNKIFSASSDAVLLPPLGLLYVASNSKYNIDVIDNRIHKLSNKELFEQLKEYDIIGFGGTIFEVKQAKEVSEMLRKIGKYTLYGGANATVNSRFYSMSFNCIVIGEAEREFDDIILKKPKGFYYCEKIFNLNNLIFPFRGLIDMTKYRRREPNYCNKYPVDTIVSSRGCPFNCSFCSSKYLWERKITYRSVENVESEIVMLKKLYGTKAIYFREDNFTVDRKRLLEMCDMLKKQNVDWICESRVDTINEEAIKKMAKCGCTGIWFGIESTNNNTLKIINKGFTIETAKNTIRLCKKYNIKTGGSFIVGFPHENLEDIKNTIRESKTLGLDHIHNNRLFMFPRSEMYLDIRDKMLEGKCYMNICLPDTVYASSEEVTNLFYNLTVNKKAELIKTLIPKKIIYWFSYTFPGITKWLRQFYI